MTNPTPSSAAAAQAPLVGAWAILVAHWLNTYGAALVTLLSLVYGSCQIYFMFAPRIRHWYALRKEAANGKGNS